MENILSFTFVHLPCSNWSCRGLILKKLESNIKNLWTSGNRKIFNNMRSKNYIDIPKHSQNQMRIKQVLNIIGPKSIQNNLVQVQDYHIWFLFCYYNYYALGAPGWCSFHVLHVLKVQSVFIWNISQNGEIFKQGLQ